MPSRPNINTRGHSDNTCNELHIRTIHRVLSELCHSGNLRKRRPMRRVKPLARPGVVDQQFRGGKPARETAV